MGLVRNLSPDEILAQAFHALRIVQIEGLPRISNVVFMGMGEPLNNVRGVKAALEVLVRDGEHQPFGFGLSKHKVVGVATHLSKQQQ